MIPYGHQLIEDDDIEAVVEVLRGEWLTQGPSVEAFEEALAATVDARFAVAFSSGTAALHAAAAVAGLGPGDVVVTTPFSFVASANCARFVGAGVAFVDIDPETLNIDLDAVAPGADALVAVHFAGLPVDLARLRHRPPVVIEDAAHALGARTPDGPVGNCAHSDLCAFSFHPVKAITTGEGGAVTTNSPDLARDLRRFRSHGAVPTPEAGGWTYEIQTLGFNYRLTDIQAALGVRQLLKLARFVRRRNELSERYRSALGDLPIVLPPAAPNGSVHAYHIFPVQVDDRRRIYDGMRSAGVGVQVHYIPIYRHPLYAGGINDPSNFPCTERVYERVLSLPLYPGLHESDQDAVVDALRKVL